MRPLPNLRSAGNGIGRSVLEEARSSRITRISLLFQFLQRGAERKEFLPHRTSLMRHLGRGRTCNSGPVPWGAGLWSWLEGKEGIQRGRNSLCAPGSSPGATLVIIQLFCLPVVPILYVLHWTILLLDLCPTGFIYVWWDAGIDSWWVFFLSFIPRWPGTNWRCPKFSLCSFCFPTQYWCFPEYGLNYSLPTLWSSKFLKVSVVKSALSLLNLEEAEEGAGSLAACASSVLPRSLLGMGMDLAANPAKSAPLGPARTKRAVTSAARSQLFPAVVCQEERPVPGLPSRT